MAGGRPNAFAFRVIAMKSGRQGPHNTINLFVGNAALCVPKKAERMNPFPTMDNAMVFLCHCAIGAHTDRHGRKVLE